MATRKRVKFVRLNESSISEVYSVSIRFGLVWEDKLYSLTHDMQNGAWELIRLYPPVPGTDDVISRIFSSIEEAEKHLEDRFKFIGFIL